MKVSEPYLIAETAFHHQGDAAFLHQLIEGAANAGADALKLHLLFNLDDYFVRQHSAYDVLKGLCLNQQQMLNAIDLAAGKELDLILLCNEVSSLRWANQLVHPSVKAIELHATGLNDLFLLEAAVDFPGTVILGSGGSTLDELQFAIDYLRQHGKTDIFLMHGFQNYPTNPEEVVLSKMKILLELFQLPVGYADHTDPQDPHNLLVSVLGVANGFPVVEKHFTHAVGEKRVDAQAAVPVEQLGQLKQMMALVHKVAGAQAPLKMSEAELKYGNTGPMKKAIVARRPIAAGAVISKEDLAFKRIEISSPLQQKDALKLLGATASQHIEQDALLGFHNVQYQFTLASSSQFFVGQQKASS